MAGIELDGSGWRQFGDGFATSDPQEAAEAVRATYRAAGDVRIHGDVDDFRYVQRVLPGDGFALARVECTVPISYQGPLDGLVCVEQVHAGRVAVETPHDEHRAGVGEICLVPPHEPVQVTTDATEHAPLLLEHDAVEAHAVESCGIEPGTLRFTGVEPISSAAAVHWQAAVSHVRDDILSVPEVAATPLVRAEAFRMLATSVLMAFPNTALTALADRAAPADLYAEPAVVRRAVEFVDANAHRPIGLADIAEAARVGPRSLQHAFRRYRDCAPLQYLKRVRLELAHRDLQAGDPTRGDTVEAVAARWGFTHPGRFAEEYGRRFGCSPSRTLRD